MRIVIGVTPDPSGSDALALGAVLAGALGGEVVLANIYAAPGDQAGRHKVDAEWLAYLSRESQETLDEAAAEAAKAGLADVTTVVHGHRSSGIGLIEVAQAEHADLIVIGSAPGAANGRFLIGSAADQLLHGSHVPVALATAFYRKLRPEALGRLVVAFQNTQESRRALRWSGEIAGSAAIPVTALTVLLRHRMFGSQFGATAEALAVEEQLREDAEEALADALTELPADVSGTSQITIGDEPVGAVQRFDWQGDELFVLASSRGGVLRRVFLGDMTYKLVRATPVPAVVLPRHT